MKYLLLLLVAFILSCSSPSENKECSANSTWDKEKAKCVCNENFVDIAGTCYADLCKENPCKEANKTACSLDKTGKVQCMCDNDYHLENNICVSDESCTPNPCKEEHKTVCTLENNKATCSCESGWADVNGKCMPDLCVEPNPCKEANKTICSLDNKGKVKCLCDKNYHLENNNCVSDESSPCHPNPCKEEHKTKCLLNPQDNSKFTCHCDSDYHQDNELCCQAFSHNESGSCVCNEKYLMREGKCKVICSEESVEAFNGECVDDNQICVQGKCIDNKCVNHTCPSNSSCATQNNQAVCYCDPGYHMDNNLCCKNNASNINGECKCNTGYHLNEGNCIQDEGNPCESNVCTQKHKNKCVVDNSSVGYHCECNQGFTLEGNECKLLQVENCPNDLICLNSYCVEDGERENEQCLKDSDCHEFNSSSTSYCNPSPVGGICLGCSTHSDCPNNTQCEENYHTCKNLCDSHSDCPSGKCSSSLGICLVAKCQSNSDCQNGSVCLNEGSGSYGLCKRIPCKEKKCSEFNQNGTCDNGKTCIYGVCTDTCNPNPCNKQEFKDVCTINSNKVVCSCRENYTENENGNCEPSVQQCVSGFTCENNFCVNRNDSGFICSNNNDCGNNSTCSTPSTLPSGLCRGCTVKSDCPNDNMQCLAGYCLQNCVADTDCNAAMVCDLTRRVCKKKTCTSSQDCGQGYVCDGESGKCERMPCN